MSLRFLAAIALLSSSTIAQADIRATYSDGSVVEINDDGSARSNVVSDGHWMLRHAGRDYLLVADGGEVKVLDPVIVEQVANAYTPDMIAHFINEVPPLVANAAGSVSVDGRPATGYRVDNEAEISFAISTDPELSELGQLIASQFSVWVYMQGPLGRLSAPLADMFATGTAVRIGNVDLVSVEEVAIDDSHFVLPGEPLDWFATEELMLRAGLIEVG